MFSFSFWPAVRAWMPCGWYLNLDDLSVVSTGLALRYLYLGNQIILWWGQTQKVKYVRGSSLTYPWYMFSTCLYVYLVACNHGFKDIICVFQYTPWLPTTYFLCQFFIYIFINIYIYIDRICTYLKYIIFNRYFFRYLIKHIYILAPWQRSTFFQID